MQSVFCVCWKRPCLNVWMLPNDVGFVLSVWLQLQSEEMKEEKKEKLSNGQQQQLSAAVSRTFASSFFPFLPIFASFPPSLPLSHTYVTRKISKLVFMRLPPTFSSPRSACFAAERGFLSFCFKEKGKQKRMVKKMVKQNCCSSLCSLPSVTDGQAGRLRRTQTHLIESIWSNGSIYYNDTTHLSLSLSLSMCNSVLSMYWTTVATVIFRLFQHFSPFDIII